jgi:hypothetical protein
MEEERTPRERALAIIKLLVGVEPNWRPAPHHYLLAIRITIGGALIVAVLVLLGDWLWGVLVDYIQPKTTTQRKDLANIFVVIAVGVVGTLTAIAAVGNLYISRRNLQHAQDTLNQQRELDEGRSQDDALRDYFEQMGKLLAELKLAETESEDDPLRLLARSQTLTVLDRLHNPRRKRDVITFLHGAGLINTESTIVNIEGANLRRSDLSGESLGNAALTNVNLDGANLTNADLSYANLQGPYWKAPNFAERI